MLSEMDKNDKDTDEPHTIVTVPSLFDLSAACVCVLTSAWPCPCLPIHGVTLGVRYAKAPRYTDKAGSLRRKLGASTIST